MFQPCKGQVGNHSKSFESRRHEGTKEHEVILSKIIFIGLRGLTTSYLIPQTSLSYPEKVDTFIEFTLYNPEGVT